MALIYCPECRKQVSEKAERCIHCGAPLSEKKSESVYVSNQYSEEELATSAHKFSIIAFILCWVPVGGLVLAIISKKKVRRISRQGRYMRVAAVLSTLALVFSIVLLTLGLGILLDAGIIRVR